MFDKFVEKKVKFISVKESLDLSTPAGKLVANILASVAMYEREVTGERIVAGQIRLCPTAGKDCQAGFHVNHWYELNLYIVPL